jgi:hypothetical protein
VLIHTNLGRTPLGRSRGASQLASGFSNLEHLDASARGGRHVHAERLLCALMARNRRWS